MPRFHSPHFEYNLEYWREFKAFCDTKGWTMTATALAWILDKDTRMIPIPATRSAKHLNDWLPACEIRLSADDRAEIDRILPVGWAHGDRYWDEQSLKIERYC